MNSEAVEAAVTPERDSVQIGGSHYLKSIQPFDIVRVWGLGFFRGNVVKYVLRCLDKNGKEDLMKARHYLDVCIENYEELRKSTF
ncbi:DUF3310 domain-containing protein [Pseudomonas putida]|uniref:DUF3310 domain-containing protein n=1 Tax=Pseudomonas putida TaxID=303 RepID=UPI0009BE60A1